MHSKARKILQVLTLSIIMLLIISFTGCFGDDSENGDNNGGNETNGNGNGNGNGGNGVDNNTTEVVTFLDTGYEPHMPAPGTQIMIWVTLESVNPIKSMDIIICIGEVCLQPQPMREDPPDADPKNYIIEWMIPPDTEPDTKIKYSFMVKDSLGNTPKSEDYYIEMS